MDLLISIPFPSMPLNISPVLFKRSGILCIVKFLGDNPDITSSQYSGVAMVAPGLGRTL